MLPSDGATLSEGHCPGERTPTRLWASVRWIMVKMLATQIEAFCAAACPRPPLLCRRRVGSGGHRRVAGAAAVSGAVGSQNYEITLRAVSLVGG